jgi:tryptophan-rich sensory protein
MVSVANLGFAFMDTSSEWFRGLLKPALMPPDIALPIAWTALCALTAVSMSLVGINPGVRKKTLILYALTGVTGVLWIYVFFCRHNAGGAVFLLIAIIAAAALLYSDSYRTSRTAAYLLIPCILWLCYTLYLSYEIAFFNP